MHIYLKIQKLTIIIILLIYFSINLQVYAESNFADNSQCTQYEVKNKETIIQILRKNSLFPVFGREGSLQKTYEINKLDKKERKELIHAGDKLCLPIRIRFPANYKKTIVNDTESNKNIKKKDDNSNKDIANIEKEMMSSTQTLEIKNNIPLNINKENQIKNERCTTYIVKNGDTIIQILKTHKLRPVFGKSGSLQKTLKINKREGKKGYLILPGNSLCLPINDVKYHLADHKNEIQEKNNLIVKGIDNKTEEILHLDSSLPIVLPSEENTGINDKIITKNEKDVEPNDKVITKNDKDVEPNDKIITKNEKDVEPNDKVITKNDKDVESNDKIITKNEKIETDKNVQVSEKSRKKNMSSTKISNEKRENKKKPEQNKKKDSNEKIIPEAQSEIQQCDKYTTEKEENIIHILRKKNITPLYGENGSYQKTIELNKNLTFDNPFLEKGTAICLPKILTTDNNSEKNLHAFDKSIKLENNKNFEENPNLFYSELGVKYLRLIGINTDNNLSSTLLSRPIVFTEAGLTQRWSKQLETYFGINFAFTEIMQSDTNVVIGDSILRLTNIIAGIKHQFYPSLYGNFQFSYGDYVIFRSIDDSTIQVEKMSTAHLRSTLGYTFLNYDKLSFQSEISYLLSTPFTNEVYNSYVGQGYELGLIQSYNDKGWGFKTKLFYLRDYTYVPPVKFDYTEIGILFKFFGELP